MSAPIAMTERYRELLVRPRPGRDVCSSCFNFTAGYRRCYACTRVESWLDHMAPISCSVSGGALHRALYGYKHWSGMAAFRLRVELAALLWRFLVQHEACLAQASGVQGFEVVTIVPSSDPVRDQQHPLRMIVGVDVPVTRPRFRRLLLRSDVRVAPRAFHRHKYRATQALDGAAVLLIDDTWTTGANAQSAAAALKVAGAPNVTSLVIGRHLSQDWHENDKRLRNLIPPFEWATCTTCRAHREPESSGRHRTPGRPRRISELKCPDCSP